MPRVLTPAPTQLGGASFTVKGRRENGRTWKVEADLQAWCQKSEKWVVYKAGSELTHPCVVSLYRSLFAGRNQPDINVNFCQTSHGPNSTSTSLSDWKWRFATFLILTLKKWEYCPVQTSSQHVNYMFYLPCYCWQLIQLHPQQHQETLHNMTMKLSGNFCQFCARLIIIINTVVWISLCDVVNFSGVLQGF